MPDDDPPGQPVVIENERAHLGVHRLNGGAGGVWIIRRLNVCLAPLGRPVIEVRHEDVNDALEEGEALERVEALVLYTIGRCRPNAAAWLTASTTCGATCSGVTKLILWHPCAWSHNIIEAISPGVDPRSDAGLIS